MPNPQQPRTHFDPEALQELADSIREHGVIQPVIVTQRASRSRARRRISSSPASGGCRRRAWRASTRMPVVVKEAAGSELLELALVENLQRAGPEPARRSAGLPRLADEFGLTQEQIAARVGRSRTAVANTLRLLALDDDIRASLASGQITEGHARALLGIDDRAMRLDAWRRIVADGLTVRAGGGDRAERCKRDIAAPRHEAREAAPRRPDPHTRAIEDDLRHALGAPVSIVTRPHGGRIVIRFHSDDELEGILDHIRR